VTNHDGEIIALEMICSELHPMSCRRNKVLPRLLLGTGSAGRASRKVSTREIQDQMRVLLRQVSLVLFSVKKNNLLREKKRKETIESKEDRRAPQPMMTAKATL